MEFNNGTKNGGFNEGVGVLFFSSFFFFAVFLLFLFPFHERDPEDPLSRIFTVFNDQV